MSIDSNRGIYGAIADHFLNLLNTNSPNNSANTVFVFGFQSLESTINFSNVTDQFLMIKSSTRSWESLQKLTWEVMLGSVCQCTIYTNCTFTMNCAKSWQINRSENKSPCTVDLMSLFEMGKRTQCTITHKILFFNRSFLLASQSSSSTIGPKLNRCSQSLLHSITNLTGV